MGLSRLYVGVHFPSDVLVGGLVGGKVFKKLSMVWLRRVFALLILYGGVRALL